MRRPWPISDYAIFFFFFLFFFFYTSVLDFCGSSKNTNDPIQTVQPLGFREPLRHALKTDMGRPDWTVPDYDLVTTFWVHSLDDMHALTADPGWVELEKEAAARSDLSIGHFAIGHEIVHFEGNEKSGSP